MAEPVRDSRARHRWLIHLLFALCLLAAAWYLIGRRHQLADAFRQLSWGGVLLSAVFGYLAVFAMVLSWIAAVRDSGVELPARDTVRIYAIGQVGKYLPGSVWPVVTQAQLARRRGASPLRVASGSLLALAVSVCVGLVFGGLLLPFSGAAAAHRLWWAPVVAIPAIAMLHPAVLNRVIALASRLLRRGPVEFAYSTSGVVRCAGWSILGNAMFGGHLFFLVRQLGASDFRGLVLSTCAYALASSIGVAIIFLPAGSGAREAVLTIVLAPAVTAGSALLVALVSRALLVVVDLSFAATQLYGLAAWAKPAEKDSTA